MDSTLWIHIIMQTFAFGIVFPTGMVLGLVKSRWHVPTQILGAAIAVPGTGWPISWTRICRLGSPTILAATC